LDALARVLRPGGGHCAGTLEGGLHQQTAAHKDDVVVVGDGAVAELVSLHLRLAIEGERSKSPSIVRKASCLDLELAAIAKVSRRFDEGKSKFSQDAGICGIGLGWVGAGGRALLLPS